MINAEGLGELPGVISLPCTKTRMTRKWSDYANGMRKTAKISSALAVRPGFPETGNHTKPNAHLCEVCYLLDKTDKQGR
jgi:hypothetical protein